jgi:hypothetical protein
VRRAVGPFLTTGIALGTAIVVVANPVAPPSSEMQISTTQLSSSPGPLVGLFDKSLLNSIAGGPGGSGALSALAKIMAALAAEADRISQGVTSQADITPPAPALQPAEALYKPEPNFLATGTPAGASLKSAQDITAAMVLNSVQQTLTNVANDGTYLGGKVIEATVAAVDVLTNTVPDSIVKVVDALIHLDPIALLNAILQAIEASLSPAMIIFDGITHLFAKQVPQPVKPTAALSLAQAPAPENLTRVAEPLTTPEWEPVPSSTPTPVNRPRPAGRPIRSAPGRPVATDSGIADVTILSERPGPPTTVDVPDDTAPQDPQPSADKPESPSGGSLAERGQLAGPESRHDSHTLKVPRGSGYKPPQSPAGGAGRAGE